MFMPSPLPSSAPKRFPLTPLDCRVLTAILKDAGAFNEWQYPKSAFVDAIAESIGADTDDVYYSLKHLRMAQFI
jgi:hypothetical protein